MAILSFITEGPPLPRMSKPTEKAVLRSERCCLLVENKRARYKRSRIPFWAMTTMPTAVTSVQAKLPSITQMEEKTSASASSVLRTHKALATSVGLRPAPKESHATSDRDPLTCCPCLVVQTHLRQIELLWRGPATAQPAPSLGRESVSQFLVPSHATTQRRRRR